MYQIGDVIIYGSEGACQVKEIGCPEISEINKARLYYTLVPVYRDGVIYTPVDTGVFMRPVITKEKAEELIREIPRIYEDPYENKNLRMMSEHYDKFLQSHTCEDLLQLIKTVYLRKKTAIEQGKKPGSVDERYMKRAEELLHGELAVALGIERETVVEYIREKIEDTPVTGAVS